jgi:hypothetical protein
MTLPEYFGKVETSRIGRANIFHILANASKLREVLELWVVLAVRDIVTKQLEKVKAALAPTHQYQVELTG